MTNAGMYNKVRSMSSKLSHERRITNCTRKRLIDWASGDLYPSTAVIILPRETWLRWVSLLANNAKLNGAEPSGGASV